MPIFTAAKKRGGAKIAKFLSFIDSCIRLSYAPVVQWIEYQIPVLMMGVRISPGAQKVICFKY